MKKASMIFNGWMHGCHIGVFEGEEGIYVAGGNGETISHRTHGNILDLLLLDVLTLQ